MRLFSSFENIYLYNDKLDFRIGIDGLAALVEAKMQKNVFGKNLFIFFNRRKDKVKILYWDNTGFALWTKRLEKERFPFPKKIVERGLSLFPLKTSSGSCKESISGR